MPIARTTKWVTVLTVNPAVKEVDRYHAAHACIVSDEYAVFSFEPPVTNNWLVFEVPCTHEIVLPASCGKFVTDLLQMLLSPYHRAARGLNVASLNGHPTFTVEGDRTIDGLAVILLNDEAPALTEQEPLPGIDGLLAGETPSDARVLVPNDTQN